MAALIAAGERAEALRQGQRYVRRLREDLDLEPDPQLQVVMDLLREGMKSVPSLPITFGARLSVGRAPEQQDHRRKWIGGQPERTTIPARLSAELTRIVHSLQEHSDRLRSELAARRESQLTVARMSSLTFQEHAAEDTGEQRVGSLERMERIHRALQHDLERLDGALSALLDK